MASTRLSPECEPIMELIELAKMRISTEVINNAITWYNRPLQSNTIELRGCKVPVIENIGAAKSYSHVDLTDNNISSLGNLPLLEQLEILSLGVNQIARIDKDIGDVLPALKILSLLQNNLRELADIEPLGTLHQLKYLNMTSNPLCQKQDYRLFVIWMCPNLKWLDARRIRVKERDQATKLFGDKRNPSKAAKAILAAGSKDSAVSASAMAADKAPGTGGPDLDKMGRLKLTDKERDRLKDAISNAKSIREIQRLEAALANGRLPADMAVDE